jgi:hypothetical protein
MIGRADLPDGRRALIEIFREEIGTERKILFIRFGAIGLETIFSSNVLMIVHLSKI